MILQLLPFWIFIGIVTAFMAYKRGRNPAIWFFFGLFLGAFGILALFFLPVLKKESAVTIAEIPPPILPIQPKNASLDKPWFFVDIHRQRQGPYYFADLAQAWQRGDFNKHSLIWCEGISEWKKVQDLPELLEEFPIMPEK